MVVGRKKTCSTGDPDRLSQLPDTLLLQILSSLEMVDVVKTGILSKRWQNLWTRVYNVVYKFRLDWKRMPNDRTHQSEYAWKDRQLKQFVLFIDRTLRQHQSDIKMFSLSIFYFFSLSGDKKTQAMVGDWIKCVLKKKVEVLDLHGPDDFPDLLFQSSLLTKLRLEGSSLGKLHMPVNWHLLKSLCLTHMSLSDESMETILLGCPVLETLSLEYIYDLLRLNIISPSVRHLILDGMRLDSVDSSGAIFKIKAPWVQELEISGQFIIPKCHIEDLSSVVKATLAFSAYDTWELDCDDNEERINEEKESNAKWIDMVPDILNALSHVAELLIGTDLVQVLSLAKLNGKPSPSFQCKILTVVSPLWSSDVLGISCLLENAPHLETLVINVSRPQGHSPLYETRFFDDEDMNLNLPKGNFVHLRNVKIDYRRNPCGDNPEYVGGTCNDIELVGYIMRSSVALQRLVLCSSSPACDRFGCSKANCSFQYVPRLSSELHRKFLPGNEVEEWELKKRKFCYEYRFSNYAYLDPGVASEEDSC